MTNFEWFKIKGNLDQIEIRAFQKEKMHRIASYINVHLAVLEHEN